MQNGAISLQILDTRQSFIPFDLLLRNKLITIQPLAKFYTLPYINTQIKF
ncbi:hypothetical protein SAMN05421813_107142 [Daejeonella rubra]|uniref:Uncharacterized protein n=1 Tax=Daejeonella rubra TaxID=990371 RepID=A0A1G9R860_9SPHI|nr:hypothetical protein SAMN05421813_107142 [Daejeonella rubra]